MRAGAGIRSRAAARAPGAAALVAGLFTVALAARWLKRRLGGYTGDTLGAAQQVVELVCLLAWLAVLETSTRT